MSAIDDQNRRAWNALVRRGQHFTRPATDEQYASPLAALDSRGWLGASVAGMRVLCLGSGGGRQGVLFAAAGATVTVVDISSEMLALDRQVAAERGLDLTTVETTMTDLSALAADSFDIVSQPVSTCYVPDVVAVYAEVARVLTAGGLYLSQHKQPASLQADVLPAERGYELIEPYYRQGPLPAVVGSLHREEGTLEFLHRWEDLVGGLCRAGFVVEDLTEPYHADSQAARQSFGHRSMFVAPYVRIKARRARGGGEGSAAAGRARMWLPDADATSR